MIASAISTSVKGTKRLGPPDRSKYAVETIHITLFTVIKKCALAPWIQKTGLVRFAKFNIVGVSGGCRRVEFADGGRGPNAWSEFAGDASGPSSLNVRREV